MVKVGFFKESLDIPEDVTVDVDDENQITVEGPSGGPITKDFSHARGIKIEVKEGKIYFSTNFPRASTLALVNTILSIIGNLIKGVQENYKYVCKVCYSHFPCNVELDSNKQELHVVNFLGERAPRRAKLVENVDVDIEDDDVFLIGPDKESLGQTAANLKKCCRIRKKDPRIYQDGVYVYKKMHGEKILWEIK